MITATRLVPLRKLEDTAEVFTLVRKNNHPRGPALGGFEKLIDLGYSFFGFGFGHDALLSWV
jgi:hypothetical protein